MKVPGHRENPTDIALWKQHHAVHYNLSEDVWVQCFKSSRFNIAANMLRRAESLLEKITSNSNPLVRMMRPVTPLIIAKN